MQATIRGDQANLSYTPSNNPSSDCPSHPFTYEAILNIVQQILPNILQSTNNANVDQWTDRATRLLDSQQSDTTTRSSSSNMTELNNNFPSGASKGTGMISNLSISDQ